MRKIKAWLYLWWQIYKDKIKPYLKPSIIISFLLAWMITNGWCYLLIAFGHGWLKIVALTYAGILWFPLTPEKIITVPLAIWFQKILFINKKKRKWRNG